MKSIIAFLCIVVLICVLFSGCQELSDHATALLDSKCDELINYFNEIALYAKDGDAGSGYLMRWEVRIRIQLFGEYTDEDYTTVKGVIDSLNAIDGMPEIKISENSPNYSIYFIPQDKMKSTILTSDPSDWGRSEVWDIGYSIYKAHTGVANDVTTQYERNSIILQQMVFCMGPLNLNDKYPDSIFNSGWNKVQSLSDMDYELLCMLYSPSLHAEMNEEETKKALRPLVREKYVSLD